MAFGKTATQKATGRLTATPGDEYDALDGVSVTERNPEPPVGEHVLVLKEFFEHQGQNGVFGIFRFVCEESDNPSNVGRSFGIARNKYPKKVGIDGYFKAIKPIFTAFLGGVPGNPEVEAEMKGKWGGLIKEVMGNGTMFDEPVESYRARVIVIPDKNPKFSRMQWEPVARD